MPAYGAEKERNGGRRQGTLAVVFLLAALVTAYLPDAGQQRVAFALRSSVLRPFIGLQQRLTDARLRSAEVEVLRAQLDSLSAILSTMSALDDENRTLRSLLVLGDRIGPEYRPASVLRPGTQGSESMFLLFLGLEDGLQEGAPVVNRHGLVGVVREVRSRTAVGMDWTHPDFRAGAMTVDGTAFGIVENRRGAFREEDRLVLAGGAFHEEIPDGTLVVTSGLGRALPRGIPIGRINGVAEVEAEWQKNYWLSPMVQPGEVTHVLVAVSDDSGLVADTLTIPSTRSDIAAAFSGEFAMSRADVLEAEEADRRRLAALADTVRLLRARLEERGGGR